MTCKAGCNVNGILQKCVGIVSETNPGVLHTISRLIDGHEHLWSGFAIRLGMDEVLITNIYLYANGGGSPAKRFLMSLHERRPNMTVATFQAILIMHKMTDIADLLAEEQGRGFLEGISYKTEDRVCAQLNSPEDRPRWMAVARTCSFNKTDIDEMYEAIRVNNIFSPTTVILTGYKQKFPLEDFTRIRDFIQCHFH